MRKRIVRLVFPFFRLYWFIVRPKSFGAKCIVEYRGKLLLIRNTYGKGRWSFPGGSVKRNEPPEVAAKREVREEVGLTVANVRRLGEFKVTIEHKDDTVTVFAAEASTDRLKLNRWEILDARWFSPDALPEISSYAERMLAMWKAEKKPVQ